MKLYHYSNEKFESFNTDMCDGIWLTDIAPEDEAMLDEVGAAGTRWVAICEADVENSMVNGDNYDVTEQLEKSGADCIENIYDGFTDYAFSEANKVKIIEWVKL